MSQQSHSDLCTAGATDPTQHRLPLPKLDILAVDADEAPREDWEAEDDVNGGPLDPREGRAARRREIQYLRDMEVYEYSSEAETRARTGRNPIGLKWIDTNKGSKCATKGPPLETLACASGQHILSEKEHLHLKPCESYSVSRVRKTFPELKTLF